MDFLKFERKERHFFIALNVALVSQKSLLLSNSYSLIFYRIRIFEMSSCLVPEKAIIHLIDISEAIPSVLSAQLLQAH